MEYTVSKLNNFIKNMFAGEYALNNIVVKGEVSECKYHSSGHIYFSIKDSASQLACVMFYQSRAGLSFKMGVGDKVLVRGSVSVYERDGKYQLYAKEITKDGVGKLYLEFEALKRKLEEEGLFDVKYKKPIPKFAFKVGIVSAATGAAIKDIMATAYKRNPYVQLVLCSAKVQGEGAGLSVAKGIKKLDGMGLDVIIVGRGGGAYEDLWAFNEEVTARAIFECKTPIISGIGHEIDFTIADYVADMRALTPTDAANKAVFDVNDFLGYTASMEDKLKIIMEHKLSVARNRVNTYRLSLTTLSPEGKLKDYKARLFRDRTALDNLMNNKLTVSSHRLKVLATRLSGLSPLTKLSSGYAYVSDEKGKGIKSINDISEDENIDVTFIDGKIKAKVVSKDERTGF